MYLLWERRARQKGTQWSRVQVQRKMDDFKSKIQTLKRKNSCMNKEQLELSYQLAEVRETYHNIKSGVTSLKSSLDELERQIHEGQLHKHGCLESTVFLQKKAKLLEDYKFGRYRCMHKTPSTLIPEEDKQNNLLNILRIVLENLLQDFPQLNLQIVQMINTVQPVLPDVWDTQEDSVNA